MRKMFTLRDVITINDINENPMVKWQKGDMAKQLNYEVVKWLNVEVKIWRNGEEVKQRKGEVIQCRSVERVNNSINQDHKFFKL